MKKNKSKEKKLTLKKVTITQLAIQELGKIKGGSGTDDKIGCHSGISLPDCLY